MRLSDLARLLESVSLGLDVFAGGRIPDVAVADALALADDGVFSSLAGGVLGVEVVLASSSGVRVVSWTWERNPNEMRALLGGLGVTAVLLNVSFRCESIKRYTEISYLCSIRDVLEHWGLQLKSSFRQQLVWFPFSELTVMTHVNPTEKYHVARRPLLSRVLESVGEMSSRCLRRISLYLATTRAAFFSGPLLLSILGRFQFFSLWSAAKHRSDYAHATPRWWSPHEAFRGASWLIPVDRVPEVLSNVSAWTTMTSTGSRRRRKGLPTYCSTETGCVVAPLFLQTVNAWPATTSTTLTTPGKKESSTPTPSPSPSPAKFDRKPFLYPSLDGPAACAVWYDWFVPECEPDPIAVAEFEGIFLRAGGVRLWSGERLTSPLVLSDSFSKYPHWCTMKSRLDGRNCLQSAYVQGTVYSESGRSVEFGSTLSLCSSIVDVQGD